MRGRPFGATVGVALALAGCGQAGMPQVSFSQAAELGVATGRITVACGTAEELRAFGRAAQPGLAGEGSIAVSGARELAAVYSRDHSRIYQGESVGAVVHDSIALLSDCGLDQARRLLRHALES